MVGIRGFRCKDKPSFSILVQGCKNFFGFRAKALYIILFYIILFYNFSFTLFSFTLYTLSVFSKVLCRFSTKYFVGFQQSTLSVFSKVLCRFSTKYFVGFQQSTLSVFNKVAKKNADRSASALFLSAYLLILNLTMKLAQRAGFEPALAECAQSNLSSAVLPLHYLREKAAATVQPRRRPFLTFSTISGRGGGSRTALGIGRPKE